METPYRFGSSREKRNEALSSWRDFSGFINDLQEKSEAHRNVPHVQISPFQNLSTRSGGKTGDSTNNRKCGIAPPWSNNLEMILSPAFTYSKPDFSLGNIAFPYFCPSSVRPSFTRLWSYRDSIVSASIAIPTARVAQEPLKYVFHVQLAQKDVNGF